MTRTIEGRYPVTPDGRYFVVRGRLWRTSDPALPEAERAALVAKLMTARRTRDRAAVDATKRALGERGPVWWEDDAPDLNRHMARNTPYAVWFAQLRAGVEDVSANEEKPGSNCSNEART